jgi:outer membrane protein assembly factor BamB
VPDSGFLNSPLVTADTVYVGDVGGFLYALARSDGKERWKINTRAAPFPGAHPANCLFAAPILADGKLIVLGEGGKLGVCRPNPARPEEISAWQVPQLHYPCWTGPVLAHQKLYLRSEDRLLCFNLAQSAKN